MAVALAELSMASQLLQQAGKLMALARANMGKMVV